MDVKVTTAGGVSATGAADQFTYSGAPTVSGLAPGRGPGLRGHPGRHHRVRGFTAQASVRFGATAAANVIVSGPTSITATSPAGSGTVEVKVTDDRGHLDHQRGRRVHLRPGAGRNDNQSLGGPGGGCHAGDHHGHRPCRRQRNPDGPVRLGDRRRGVVHGDVGGG